MSTFLGVLGLLTIVGGVLAIIGAFTGTIASTQGFVGLGAVLYGIILCVVGKTGSTVSEINSKMGTVGEINSKIDILLEWIQVNQSKGIDNVRDRDKGNIVRRKNTEQSMSKDDQQTKKE